MATINPTQLPRITREYLDSLKVPGKNFPFEITYANRRKNFALIFSIERELTEAERNTAVDIQIDVAGIPTGQNIQNPIDRPMVHFSYYGKLNDLVQGGRSFEVNVTKCVNEEGNGTLFVAPYVGGKHKTIAVNLTGASTNGGAVIQLLNLATSLNFTRNLQYGNYGPIVEMGEARPHGSLILNSQSKSGWDSVVEPGKFAEWALSFPIGINWDDISNKINIGIIFNNNTKKFYSGLVDNSYNTINGRGGVAGISDVSAMVYDYEIYPTRSRGERAYDRSSPGRLNTRAVLDMEKLFKRTFNLNALTDEEIDDISHIKISFTLNNDKGTIHFHFYPQRHLSVWNTSIASDIRLSKRSLVFSSYYIRPTKLLEGPELINIPNIDSFADRNIRKMVRMYSVVDNSQIKIVTPRMDTGEFNGVPGVNVERAAFLKSNMPENFRGRVDLAKARFFDVVLEDGTILASEGTIPPAPTLFDEVNQVYFACTARGSSMIVLNCNDGTVVDHVEFLQPDEVSFIINGVPTKNTGLKGYTQSLSLKPNAKPQDIYNNQCTIRVTISKNGRSESKEIELYAADIGRFSGQAMFFAFFEWGAPPVKLNYRDFFHEHPYGRQPILFKVYEENSRTPISETTAKSFYIRSANPVVFYPIGRKPTADYWGMPTALAPDGSSSKIPNIAVINDKSVIEKLSDYSEIGTLFRTNYTTLLVLDKTKNRFEFKLYQYEKTIAKDIEYFIAKNYARPNMAQPTTRLDRMTVFFVDDETGVPSVIGSIKSSETDSAQKAVRSWSSTEELDQYSRQAIDMQPMTYSNTFSMSADTMISRNFRKIMAAGRRGKIAIAFYEPLNNGASERSYWDYKYVYWCRLRDDIVQHTQDSRFLITTGVDDIYTIPKMMDLQVTGPGSFTNKLISGGIIYDAESMPSTYHFDHPRYESLSDQPLVASGKLLYDIHRRDDTTFNTSSKPTIPHTFGSNGNFVYDLASELLVVGINGFGLWEHSVEAIGVIAPNTLPTPQPEIATDDVERVIWRAATGNTGVFSQTMVQVKFKSSIPVERRNGNTVYFRILDSKGNRIGQSSITIGQYQQFNASLGVLNDISSPYLTIESYTDAGYTKKVSETRIPNALFGRQQTVASINNGQPFTAAQSNNLYMQYYLYPESLKITNVNPAITINDASVINSKYVVVVDQNIPPQRDAYFFGHGSWRMTSKMSGNKLYMGAPIYDNFPAGTKQDYFLEWQEGGELKGISGPHDLPTNIKSVGDNANIPNGFLILDNQARGQLTLTADSNFITNTTYKVESVEGNTRTTIADKGYTGFRQNPQATFDVGFPGKTPQTLAISQTKINVEMTVDNSLVTSKSLGFANNQLSSTAYGAIVPLSAGSTIPKYATSVVKSQNDPLVTFNLNSQNRNDTIGKIAVLRPGNNGLSRVEINHDGSANGIRVPFDYFTKAGNNDSYEAMFLLYGKDADANKVIGHAVIALARNQLKEDSSDYDFGLGQILMILNKAGNGVMLKAMVPHGLLTRAEEFVLLNERKPNSTYNVTMETSPLYDIVSIDGVLQDTPQPGSTVVQFGIRKDGELKRGKRITLTQLNVSTVVESQDNANNRIYTYDYASVNHDNRIDLKLIKDGNDILIMLLDKTGKNVTNEVDSFFIIHNTIANEPAWFSTFVLRVGDSKLRDKLDRPNNQYRVAAMDNPHLVRMMTDLADKTKHHGVVLVHRSVNDGLSAIYHNTGFVNMTSEAPTVVTDLGIRYLQINDDGTGFSKLAFGNTWSDRPSSHPRTHQFNYTNNQGWVSTTSADRNDLTRLNHMAGSGIYPKEIESSEGTYATFIFIYENSGQSGQDTDLRLYKDDFVPGLYMKKFSPEYTTTKHLGYVESINNANMVPLAGIIKQSDKIGFDSDYTIRRNTLVNQAGVDDTTPDVIGKYPSRIIYVNNTHGNLDSGVRYANDVLLPSSAIRNQNDNTKMTISPFFNAMLPDVNQNFTEECGTANLSRDLSEWRVEATVFNALTRLNMSEYPIMEITGPNLQPVSTDILRIRGPENKRPIVLNQVQNNILTTAPRVLVIENDICFDAAEGVDLDKVKLIPDNPSRPTVVIMRGRLILRHRRFANISGIGIASSFILINETQWDLDQLFRIAVLRGKDSLDPGFDIRRVRRIELSVRDDGGLNTRMYLPKGYIKPAVSRAIDLTPPNGYTGGVTNNGNFSTGVSLVENTATNDHVYEGGTMRMFGPREIKLGELKSFSARDTQRGHEAPFRFVEVTGTNPKTYVFELGKPKAAAEANTNTGVTPESPIDPGFDIRKAKKIDVIVSGQRGNINFRVYMPQGTVTLPEYRYLEVIALDYPSERTIKTNFSSRLPDSDGNMIYEGSRYNHVSTEYFGLSKTIKVKDLDGNQEKVFRLVGATGASSTSYTFKPVPTTPASKSRNMDSIEFLRIGKPPTIGAVTRHNMEIRFLDKLSKPKLDESFYLATEDTFLRREFRFQITSATQSDNPKSTYYGGTFDTRNNHSNEFNLGTETEDIYKSRFASFGNNEDDRKLMMVPLNTSTRAFNEYHKLENNRYTIDNERKVIRGADGHVSHVRAEDALYIHYSNNGSEITSGLFFKSKFRMNSDVAFEFDVTTNGAGKLRHRFAKDFQRDGYWYTFYKSDKIYHKHSLDLGRSFEIVVRQNNRSRNDTIVYMDDTVGVNRAKRGYGLSTVPLNEFKEVNDIFDGPGYAVNSSNGVQWVHMTNVNVTAHTSENLGGGGSR